MRIVAAVVAALAVLPLWRLLPQHATGLAGTATAEAAATYASLIWNGVLLALIPAILAALLMSGEKMQHVLARAAAPLTRPRALPFAAALALLAMLLSAYVAVVIMAGKPTLIDSFAQLTQARYMAAGHLAGPVGPGQEFWHIQQTIVTPHGWVSQYPPGYMALLALGFVLHAVALVGPVMLGVAVFFTALVADEIFESRALGRTAALLAALSSFMLAQAGSYMSHVPAAAFAAAALYFVLRGMRGGAGYALGAGICIGALFSIRPLTGAVTGFAAVLYVLFDRRPLSARASRIAVALFGAAPFLIAVALYNAHFFGSAARFGYDVALGPGAGLGFRVDPWGNSYGITEALGYTAAELTALSIYLLETPFPLVLCVGLYFALSATLPAPTRLLFWWVASLVIAYMLYWHHGLFMGPRMLADMGTLWVLLVVLAVAGLIGRVPVDSVVAGRYGARAFVLGGATVLLLVGVLVLTPLRLFSYTVPTDVQSLLRAPAVSRPALVFVHGGWSARIGMRLAAHGMRLDSVETALRQNGTCKVHHYALDYAAGRQPVSKLDFAARATGLPANVQLSPGNRIRIAAGERIDEACAAEMVADTAGVVDVSPYVWQGDLPGLDGRHGMFVRDMGPSENAALIARHKDREPLMLIEKNGRVELVDYQTGMRARWGSAQ